MSKRGYMWAIGIVAILIAGFVAGFLMYRVMNPDSGKVGQSQEIASEKITDECTEEAELYKMSQLDGTEVEEVVSEENKISPNAELIIKKNYKECQHTSKEYAELPKDLVNLTQEELKTKYPDFIIEKFSKTQVILYKDMSGICNEHYILREKDGMVAVYTVDAKDKETLLETTGVSLEYLPETDLDSLKKGIKIYGKEQLNTILEDFE